MIIFDSNYVCWVCSFALSEGMLYRGGRTEIIYGFFRQMISVLENFSPTQVVFTWDSKISKRREIYPEYKANRRKELTEEAAMSRKLIYLQFEEIKNNAIRELGFSNCFEVEGYEADDIIAKLVQNYPNEQEPTIVISSDEDLYQLLDFCSIYAITKKQTTDKEIFKRHYGIEPAKWSEVKAIAGCGTDNIKGVSGIGEKTAAKYLLGQMKPGKKYKKILDSKQLIKENLRLVKLPFENTPTPKVKQNHLDISKFVSVCKEYGFESFLDKKTLSRWEAIISRIH